MREVFRPLCLALITAVFGCGRGEKPAATESGEAPLRSGEVRLSSAKQQALGLQTARVRKQNVADALITTGWLMPVPGNEAVIKSAGSGFITQAAVDAPAPFPALGADVSSGKTLATLQVFVSPQEQAQLVATKEDVDASMAQAEVTIRLIGDQLQRYRTAQEAVNGTRLVELQELYDKAQAAYREAKEKLPYLPNEPYPAQIALKPVPISSPLTGRIVAVHVAPRQFVAAGDPLWTVADWTQFWLRVPVFETDVGRLEQASAAQISLPGVKASNYNAVRIAAPQSTDASRRTVDFYYRVENVSNTLRPGQALSVSIPTSASAERIVMPFESVLWDERGGTWSYVRSGDDEFRRQRVELGRRIDGDVVVERGLSDDAEVVVVGAQTLYGEEFKSATPVDDD